MSVSVTSKGKGQYRIYVSVHNPNDQRKPWQRKRTVGAGTKWPCASKEEARRFYGEPWETEFIQLRDGGPSAGSLTFGQLRQQYIAAKPLQANILRILNGPVAELDGAIREQFRDSYLNWIELKERQDVRKKIVEGEPAKFRSPETMRCYKRYVKVIVNSSDDDEWIRQIRKIQIGKGKPREITIQPEHIVRLEEVVRNDFAWFWMHLDFPMRCPIRPFDQFNTLRRPICQLPLSLAYKPHKTYDDTGRIAVPFIYEDHKAYFRNPPIESEFVFPNRDGSCLYPSEKHALYAGILKRICKKAGIPAFEFYQLRHIAVARLIAEGKSDSEIMKAAGWSSREMLDHYHAGNPTLIEYFREKYSNQGEFRENKAT